jgi:hypothetical protein
MVSIPLGICESRSDIKSVDCSLSLPLSLCVFAPPSPLSSAHTATTVVVFSCSYHHVNKSLFDFGGKFSPPACACVMIDGASLRCVYIFLSSILKDNRERTCVRSRERN